MLKGFKTQLKPNNHQITKFAQHCGVARYAYNWGLDVCFEAIEARNQAKEKGEALPKFPTSIDYECGNCGLSINRDLNAAINIRDYSLNAVSSTMLACGARFVGEDSPTNLA